MPSPALLQQLHLLDESSPQFPNRLSSLLHEETYNECTTNLRDEDWSWLVEYLDNALHILHPTNLAFRRCLRKLGVICGGQQVLPRSYILPADPANITKWPFASNGSCDIFEGFLDGSKVCIKRLRVYSAKWPKDVKRAFCREAIVWRHLEHPNIVPLLGVTMNPFQFVAAWMPGGDLPEYISTHPSVDRLRLLSDVAAGLGYLHSYDVIHGDLKGPSILVDDAGRARLTDFGLSVVTPDFGSTASMTDGHAGRWAAPEILDMVQPVNKASDIYSFAMVIIEVFTGVAPFYDRTLTSAAVDVLSGNRPQRPTHPSLTDDLWNLTQLCWNQDPQRRPEISRVILRLRTTVTPRHGDDAMLSTVTPGCVQQKQLPSVQQPWKLDRSCLASRPTPGKDPDHGAELQSAPFKRFFMRWIGTALGRFLQPLQNPSRPPFPPSKPGFGGCGGSGD